MSSPDSQHYSRVRLIGRVFTYDSRLHFVLGVDEDGRFAQVSVRKGSETQVLDMPVSEVALRLSGYLEQ